MLCAVRWLLAALALVVGTAFAYAVWPTPYRYDHMERQVIRIHRFTHRADALDEQGWRPLVMGRAPTLDAPYLTEMWERKFRETRNVDSANKLVDANLLPAELWEVKVREGMSPESATAYVSRIHGPPRPRETGPASH